MAQYLYNAAYNVSPTLTLLTHLLLPSLCPLPLLPHTLPRLLHQPLKLATPRQSPQILHAKRQVIMPPSLVLARPSRPLLLLAVQFAPHGEHIRIRLLHTNGREGIQSLGEVRSFVLYHGHEVEFDFRRGVVREAGLDGVPRHPDPVHVRCRRTAVIVVFIGRRILIANLRSVRPHAYGTSLQPIEFVHAPILLVRDVRNEVKHVVVVRGGSFGLAGVAQECVLGPSERIVGRAYVVAGSDGLAA
mmetsp:Transcript_12707/g.23027  ORF Transcript_12707/g.23027 Transcript_12707/m.23027 type:complete len:245 (-) Transcript_12707:682-1416(-)